MEGADDEFKETRDRSYLVAFARLGEILPNHTRVLDWTRFGDIQPGLGVILPFLRLLVPFLTPRESHFLVA